ncbi:MAG: ABC transporter permease [Planctomycetota bacterium]
MRALDRKLVRDLLAMRSQVLALVAIIACGVASLVTMFTAYRGLGASRDAYFGQYRMADVFAPIERAPRSVIRELELIPGVCQAEGRIVFDVTVDVEKLPEPVSGRALSVPDAERPKLNDLHMTGGSWFEGAGIGEVIVADAFARAHSLQVGDQIGVILNDRKAALRIVGTALSPEFVYLIRGIGDVLPNANQFTVLWLSTSFAESAFGFREAVNDVVATLDDGARQEDVIDELDAHLERFGALGAYGREAQLSTRYLAEELRGLESSTLVTPAIFLGVAAFVLYVLLSRLVSTQRTQIALMRAIGYTAIDVSIHYLAFGLLVGVLGGVLGLLLGIVFAHGVLGLYQEFFQFPVLRLPVDGTVSALGLLASMTAAALGAVVPAYRVLRLDPADGLRPEAPTVYGRTLVERVRPLWQGMGLVGRMVLRHVTRTPVRALVTAFGGVLATAVLIVSAWVYDAWEDLLDAQYRLVERQDVRILLHGEHGRDALQDVRRLVGVLSAEPELIVPVELVCGVRHERTAITGLSADHELLGLVDRSLRAVSLPAEGLLLSSKLADTLGVHAGEVVHVRVLRGERRTFDAIVTATVDEYLGVFAYAEIGLLSRWLDESFAMNGARLRVDPSQAAALGRELKNTPGVAAVAFKRETLAAFRATAERSQKIMGVVLVLFAGVIAFGVIYNTARISLASRQREIGSLLVLGYSTGEASALIAGESLLLTALGLLPGIAVGAWWSGLLARAYETDLYRMPFTIRADTVLEAAALVVVFAVLANALVLRRLRQANLIEILKTRE